MMPDDSSRYWVMHSSARMDTLRMFKVLWLSAKSVGKAEACDHRWGRGQFTLTGGSLARRSQGGPGLGIHLEVPRLDHVLGMLSPYEVYVEFRSNT